MNHWSPLHVLKLFLPSWNFFDDFDAVPRLEVRWVLGHSEWRSLFPVSTTRSWWRAFYNPWGNLELLERSQVERAADELEELVEPARVGFGPGRAASPSLGRSRAALEFCGGQTFALLTRLVAGRLRAVGVDSTVAHEFQFRLVLTPPGAAREILFVSPVCRLGADVAVPLAGEESHGS